ncbi:hypothetical protein BFJ68_g13008 [Fusarium oxysporum]|uniref:Uncharacterized protein n=1 Tax=Fusarium oxysporum TaxID=5507 RepID=A0A420Q5D2_FUSOX|nr:hypothetical protein BFJ68_g13008 [Fusarium oxysporum]
MSHLKYYAYDGVGARNKQQFKYSQAVRVGDKIECGWNLEHANSIWKSTQRLTKLSGT